MLLLWALANLEVCGQASYQEAVSQGLRFQMQADSIQRMVEAQTLALAAASASEKNKIRNAISEYNAQATALQKKANEWFAQAISFEGAPAPVAEPVLANDTVPETEIFDLVAISEETPKKTENKPEPVSKQASEFAILPKSPYSADNPVPIDMSLPDGVVYKIQLGAFSKPLSANTFKGLTPITGEKMANGLTKYYVGIFRQFAAADDALRKVCEYGFKDSFIIAFYNGKTINPERAKQLETNK
jgi:hypothetical protein